MPPFFSIILPTYNRSDFIEIAIQSVLNQNYTDWELLIIDDGSTDNTAGIVKKYFSDERIIYKYQTNQERSRARNNGIAIAKGRFVCFLDSDDYYLPIHLQVLKEAIELHQYKSCLYYTNYFVNRNGNNIVGKGFSEMKKKGISNILFEELLQTNSVCIAADLLINDRFPEKFNMFEDNHLWLRIIAKSEMIYINTPTNVFCDHENRSLSISSKKLKEKGQKYIDVLFDLFYSEKYIYLNDFISEKEKKMFIASKMIVMAYDALNSGALFLVYYFLFKSIAINFDPEKILSYCKLFFGSALFIVYSKIKGTLKT